MSLKPPPRVLPPTSRFVVPQSYLPEEGIEAEVAEGDQQSRQRHPGGGGVLRGQDPDEACSVGVLASMDSSTLPPAA